MLINNYIFSEHSGFMHIAKFNCACLKTLKTGPAMAGPTPYGPEDCIKLDSFDLLIICYIVIKQ